MSGLFPEVEPRQPETEPEPLFPENGAHRGDGLRDYEPIQPQPAWRSVARKLWAPIAALGALLVKFKFVLLALFKFKLFATAGTMLVSIAAYALLWGWWFGLGLVLLIFVHELGHVIELRRQGVPASAPLFIPFLGAVVGMKQLPDDAWKEAKVALAGPILGSVGAAAVWIAGEALHSHFLVALAFIGFFINLFNLIPVVPLDGGRAVAALHPAVWLAGLAGLLALTILRPNPILLLVLVLGGFELWRRWQERGTPQADAYYRVRPWQRVATGVVYGGLVVLLALGMSATHVERHL
jgi:Zn-dependent protease